MGCAARSVIRATSAHQRPSLLRRIDGRWRVPDIIVMIKILNGHSRKKRTQHHARV